MGTGRFFERPGRGWRAEHAERDFEQATVADLKARRALRLHVLLLAGLCTALCWGVSAALLAGGLHSLLWRPLLALALTWPLYLGLLWLWSRWLISRDEASVGDALDLADGGLDLGQTVVDGVQAVARGALRTPRPPMPGAGSFGGGGADAGWVPPDLGGALGDSAGDALGEIGGQALAGAGEALGAADDAAVVVVPLLVVLGVGVALAGALGFVVFGLFGVEVLLGVAVEIAFASLGGALAWRARREGWLTHALRRTAGPMGGLLLCVAAAGWALQTWLPQAGSWPQALRMLLATLSA